MTQDEVDVKMTALAIRESTVIAREKRGLLTGEDVQWQYFEMVREYVAIVAALTGHKAPSDAMKLAEAIEQDRRPA